MFKKNCFLSELVFVGCLKIFLIMLDELLWCSWIEVEWNWVIWWLEILGMVRFWDWRLEFELLIMEEDVWDIVSRLN